MAHENINERRRHIQSLVDSGVNITRRMKYELAAQFTCSIGAIYRDVAVCTDPITGSGYRDTESACSQNNRARRLGIDGEFTAQEWRALRNLHDNRCVLCGKIRPLGPDHIHPLSKGGTNWIGNIQPVCQPCNSSKGALWEGKR